MKKSITVKAKKDNLREVTEFIDDFLNEKSCPVKTRTVLDIVLEEIFINIASYAYNTDIGEDSDTIEIACDISDDGVVKLIFMDDGVQYNPLEKKDPKLDVVLEEREIGGLGIFMVKNMVDNISYEYAGGKNILKIEKLFEKI